MLQRFRATAVAWEIRRAIRPLRASAQSLAERAFYNRLIPKGTAGCIIDVGANGGSKTEIFRNLASRVVAIEPDPTSAQLLRTRFRFRPNVVVLECAIADAPGMIAFFQFGAGSAFNTASAAWAESMMDGSNHMHARLARPAQIQVPALTLASIADKFGPTKYIKIDAEGFEQQVVSTLRSPCPLISMEFNLPQMQEAMVVCIRHIEQNGHYRFNAAITEPPRDFACSCWLSGDEMLQQVSGAGWRYLELYARAA